MGGGAARSLWGVALVLGALCAVVGSGGAASPAPRVGETIVFVRHGEKPAEGLGQLTCQGLNRALALPTVLIAKFGRPDFIFAPDPGQPIRDNGVLYNYVRPLATIEPTAIRLGMPVNTQFGADQIDQFERTLVLPQYAHALVFAAWEHTMLDRLVKHMIAAAGGDPAVVPTWAGTDYDSIFVVGLTRDAGKTAVTFARDAEGLNGQSTACPLSQ